jgi:hypothetical protein
VGEPPALGLLGASAVPVLRRGPYLVPSWLHRGLVAWWDQVGERGLSRAGCLT